MAQLLTEMWVRPASLTFLRRTPAPRALEPIPASQATIILRTCCRSFDKSRAGAGSGCSPDVLPPDLDCCFNACMRRVASDKPLLSSSPTRTRLSSMDAVRNDTSVEAIIDSATPIRDAFGVISRTAKIEPGEAGETRPALNNVSVNTPVMPPRITARIRRGFISTYGK